MFPEFVNRYVGVDMCSKILVKYKFTGMRKHLLVSDCHLLSFVCTTISRVKVIPRDSCTKDFGTHAHIIKLVDMVMQTFFKNRLKFVKKGTWRMSFMAKVCFYPACCIQNF